MSEASDPTLVGMPETALAPLYWRAMESLRPDALIKDEKAVALVTQGSLDFSRVKQIKMNELLNTMRNLFTREMDCYARDFLSRHPQAVIVHIGCGMDARFERVDNGQVEWYDMDLPDVIALRRKYIGEERERYHLLACSVLEDAWLEAVKTQLPRPILFLAETVFVYFAEAQVKALVLRLREHFPGAELVFDGWRPFEIWLGNRYLSNSLFAGLMRWGLWRGQELEGWGRQSTGEGIHLLDEWGFFDQPEPRLAPYRWMAPLFRWFKPMRIFHFQLGKAEARKENAMQTKSNFILLLSDATANLEQVGGKGASLRRLATAGLPVPDGFHVTTAAYAQFVAANHLEAEIIAALADIALVQPATLDAAARRIRAAFEAGQMPEAIAAEVAAAYSALGEPSVAVRSSATAEDLPELSFAGQQETYLNVQGIPALLSAVQRCWGSLWTPRAIGYRLQHGIDQQAVSLAVVVQRLVQAEAAGILFTTDPVSGQRDRVLISASWGLGEAVVGGLVTPDSLSVEKASCRVLNRQTADKQVMTVRTADGTEQKPVPEHLRQAPVLDDAAAAQLTALGVQIEQLYGQPMDIEWAWVGGRHIAEGQFSILQARPITALPAIEAAAPLTWPKPPHGVMYGRTSFAEQIPNPVSPLFATLGLRMADIPTQELMRQFTRARINYAYVPVNGYVFMVAGLSFPELVAYMRMTVQITRLVFHAQEHCQAARQEFVKVIQEWEAKDIATLSPSELLSGAGTVFQAAVRLYTHIQAGTVPLSTFSEAGFTQFYNRLVRRKGDPAATTFLFGSETVALRAEKALFDLAAWCRERPTLADYLHQTSASQVAQALSQPLPPAGLSSEEWAAWGAHFQAYLEEHGQMTYDLDFANPVPAEQPTALLETIKMYLQDGGSDPYARHLATLERRAQATTAILARLHWPLRGWFQSLLRWAQNAAPGREDSLADLGLGHPLIRRYLNELGRRLAVGGAIPDAESIYWLEEAEVQDLIAALEAGQPLPNLSSRIPPRRAEQQRYLKVTPPAMLPEKSNLSILVPWHRTSDDQSSMHGIGTSVGQVTAPACVLFGPEDFPRMRPGDVLVAVTTTPAWTPLFAMASAVVTDIGGPLSHSSIVAREYGIPAVMAAGNATRRIHTGQVITVDGSAGTVTLKG